jgi:hypothetical protein
MTKKSTQNENVAGSWSTQSRWMNGTPSKMGVMQSWGLVQAIAVLIFPSKSSLV